MTNETRPTLLCPSNITNLTMHAGEGMYLKSFKFVVDQCREPPELVNATLANLTANGTDQNSTANGTESKDKPEDKSS